MQQTINTIPLNMLEQTEKEVNYFHLMLKQAYADAFIKQNGLCISQKKILRELSKMKKKILVNNVDKELQSEHC
jgi:hypothetical protein